MAKFRAGCLLAVLLLCSGAGPMMTTEKIAAIRRVAVMSAVGDKFTVRKIGITVFGNDEKEFPIDAWGIDQFVVNKVRSVLARRFEVRPVAYNKSAFLRDDWPFSAHGTRTPSRPACERRPKLRTSMPTSSSPAPPPNLATRTSPSEGSASWRKGG